MIRVDATNAYSTTVMRWVTVWFTHLYSLLAINVCIGMTEWLVSCLPQSKIELTLVPQGTSDRRRCSREWATSSSSSRAVDSHQCHGVKRPHLTLEKAPRAGLGKIKRRELPVDCYWLACAVCKSADAQNYEEIDWCSSSLVRLHFAFSHQGVLYRG